MEISGRVAQVIVKEGKDHDIRFALGLDDDELVQLLRWLRSREGIVLHIEPRVYQQELQDDDDEELIERRLRLAGGVR